MSYYEFHSNIEAPCGVGKCTVRFHSEIEWAYHCKKKHKTFYKQNQMAHKFNIQSDVPEGVKKQ
jgi:hypothetical protein